MITQAMSSKKHWRSNATLSIKNTNLGRTIIFLPTTISTFTTATLTLTIAMHFNQYQSLLNRPWRNLHSLLKNILGLNDSEAHPDQHDIRVNNIETHHTNLDATMKALEKIS